MHKKGLGRIGRWVRLASRSEAVLCHGRGKDPGRTGIPNACSKRGNCGAWGGALPYGAKNHSPRPAMAREKANCRIHGKSSCGAFANGTRRRSRQRACGDGVRRRPRNATTTHMRMTMSSREFRALACEGDGREVCQGDLEIRLRCGRRKWHVCAKRAHRLPIQRLWTARFAQTCRLAPCRKWLRRLSRPDELQNRS